MISFQVIVILDQSIFILLWPRSKIILWKVQRFPCQKTSVGFYINHSQASIHTSATLNIFPLWLSSNQKIHQSIKRCTQGYHHASIPRTMYCRNIKILISTSRSSNYEFPACHDWWSCSMHLRTPLYWDYWNTTS